MVDIIELKIRKIDFQFPGDIPFQWNPGNPYWGNFVNFITLIAPAFEGYFIRATRDAMPRINNPKVAEEADLFCKQEAQHSKHHLAHLKLLTNQYPGLEQVYLDVKASYQNLYNEESLEFHLGYAAVVELCFGPLARFIVENRQMLFKESDTRIASFILWHLVEEFEHRNSAFNIFNDVVGSYWYRLKMVPAVIKHLAEIEKITREGLNQNVPTLFDGIASGDASGFAEGISIKSKAVLVYELLCTLLPYHNPNNIQQPEWVTQWFKDEEAGVDMRYYYPG